MEPNSNQVDINALRNQFEGAMYSELVESHMQKQVVNMEVALFGYMELFSEEEIAVNSDLIDEVNRRCRYKGFLQTDCMEAFDSICGRFEEMLKERGSRASSQSKFHAFQVVTLNLAISARDDKKGFYEIAGIKDVSIQEKLLTVLRWIAVLPSAIIAAGLTSFITRMVVGYGIRYGGGASMAFQYEHPIIYNQILDITSSIALAVAFVVVATWVAPSYKKHVIFVFAGMILLLSLYLIFPMIVSRNYLIIFQIIALNMGWVIGVAKSIPEF
jgi:hypothetical protein